MRPTTQTNNKEEEYRLILERMAKNSRDHTATMGDEEMLIALCIARKPLDQALMQIQRDLSILPTSKEQEMIINSLLQAAMQLSSRLLKMADEGQKIIDKRNAK